MYKIEGMSHTNETDVDDPRSRQPTAWEPPIPTKANSSYGAPPAISPIQNKPSALATYGDNTQKPYDLLAQQNYEQAWSSQSSAQLPDWQEQHYDIRTSAHATVDEYQMPAADASEPWSFSSYDIAPAQADIEYDKIIATLEQMEQQRAGMLANPIYAGNTLQAVQSSQPTQPQPLHSQPSYFQRAKNFLWRNTQRRVTTIIITTLIIGGIIGAYFGTKGSNSSNQNPRNCTYPEGVNQKFTELQATLTTGSTGLSIPGLDPATCSLISSVINNTVSALKMGGYACWQNVQSALMPLASSALALNMDNIGQIINAVKQYCFSSTTSSTAVTSLTPITSPANTFTTFKTTPMTSTPTTMTTTTSGASTTAVTTTTPAPSTVTTTITSTSPTTIQTTATSLVTTSTGTTTTLAPSTTTTISAGTTTVTTLAPTTSTTLFVATSTPSTIQTTTSTTTPTTTTTTSTTTTTTTKPTTTTTLSTTKTLSVLCAALKVALNGGTCPSILNGYTYVQCSAFSYNCACVYISQGGCLYYPTVQTQQPYIAGIPFAYCCD